MIENTVLSLSYGNIVIKPPEKLHGLVPESFETYQIVDPQDIIIRPTDLQNDWTSLRVGLSRHRGIITSAYICLKAFGEISPEYAYLLLHTYDLLKVFYGMGSGLRQNLGFDDLRRMPVLLPSLDEQRAIVSFLDAKLADIDRYIAEKERLIDLLQEQKTALINQAVTRGLNPLARMKSSGIEWLGEIPEHWEERKIGSMAKVGNGSTPNRSNNAYWNNGIFPWLNSSHVNHGVITEGGELVSEQALKECHLPIVPPNSVLVGITGQGKTRGMSALLIFEATINQHIAYITLKDNAHISPRYLNLVLAGLYPYLRAISDGEGSTKGALTCEDMKHFKLPLPPIEEQIEILEYVDVSTKTIRNAIADTEKQIEIIQEYRTALIAEAVTGKIQILNS